MRRGNGEGVDGYEHHGLWGWVPWRRLQDKRTLWKLDLTQPERDENQHRTLCLSDNGTEDQANLVGSATQAYEEGEHPGLVQRVHQPVLDLDVPCYLVPSTTTGHSHLYIQVDVPEDKYLALLDALADCGIIGKAYNQFAQARKQSFLRLPWVKKKENDILDYETATAILQPGPASYGAEREL